MILKTRAESRNELSRRTNNRERNQCLTRAKAADFACDGAILAASSLTRLSRAINDAVMKYSLRSASRVSPLLVLWTIFIGCFD